MKIGLDRTNEDRKKSRRLTNYLGGFLGDPLHCAFDEHIKVAVLLVVSYSC